MNEEARGINEGTHTWNECGNVGDVVTTWQRDGRGICTTCVATPDDPRCLNIRSLHAQVGTTARRWG